MKNTIEKAAVDIALKKLDTRESTDKIVRPRLGTGGDFADVFFWDTAFTVMWAKYYRDTLPVECSLDNLYRVQDDDGFINRQYLPIGEPKWSKKHPISFAPPVLSWAELDVYSISGDTERIRRVYPRLKAHHAYCKNSFQQDDNLYIGDPFGCGMDNLPRWPQGWKGDDTGITFRAEHMHPSHSYEQTKYFVDNVTFSWNIQARYIDMSAQMAFDALCLKQMAEIVDCKEDIEYFTHEHALIRDAINEKCWNETHHFYFDLGYDTQVERFHIGSFWVLLADIVPGNHLENVINRLTEEATFGRPTPVPTLAANDPDYDPGGGYWHGSSWPPTTYMVLRGLKAVGAENTARELAEKYYNAVVDVFNETGTFWENMCPEKAAPGNAAQKDFCGWSGLAPVAVAREFLD